MAGLLAAQPIVQHGARAARRSRTYYFVLVCDCFNEKFRQISELMFLLQGALLGIMPDLTMNNSSSSLRLCT